MIGKLLGTPTGRAVLIGLVVIIAGYVARLVYLDASADPDIERSAQVKDALTASVPALREHIGSKDPLPRPAGWTPAVVPCGAEAQASPEDAANPTWKALGIDLSKPTRFQYRFRTDGDDFELLARSDNDCDGLYQVHRLKGDKGWTGVGADKVRVDNPGE